ncbi:hypothetical protein OS493_038345 [Desmophyllum pertusum]|uniref:Uncharacterized protein n=1 Tax=Desmophyllum pertusum TaxID=174260 RepID=A0A9X0CVJ7_9CNID|nr:hypothetical protein OS493_038345 [Desmophyllum pertusum]
MDEPAKSISNKHSVCKQVLAVLTVLCALGGVMYATGVGKHIHEALNQMITPEQKSNLQRRSPSFGKPSEPLEFKTAAVSADYKRCSEYGAQILQVQKGNAIDAAIATALCVGVVNAHSAGIGGGGFMIIYDKKSGKTRAINFRESVAELERADTMRDIQHLMYEWKVRETKTNVPGEGEWIGIPGELRDLRWRGRNMADYPGKICFNLLLRSLQKAFQRPPP